MISTASAARTEVPDARTLIAAIQRDLLDWVPPCVVATLEALERVRMSARSTEERVAVGAALTALQTQVKPWTGQLLAALHEALDTDRATPPTPLAGHGSEPVTLSLMAEEVIDEEIAVSRLVQQVESGAEALLRELASRCSRLRGWPEVSNDAHPLRPALVAQALRSAVARFDLPPVQRVALLRELAAAIGNGLPKAYARELELLRQWGVEHARFKLRLTETGNRPAETGGRPSEPLRPAAEPMLRLREHVGQAAPQGVVVAPEVMERLLSVLVSRTTLNPGSRELIRRLDAPARRLAQTQPQLLAAPDHPLWKLLDRVVSAGAVHDDLDSTRPGPVGDALERAVQAMERVDPPGTAECEAALRQVDQAVSTLLDEQAGQIEAQAQGMAREGEREDEARRLREQLVLQVRATQAPPALTRFLLGPWAQVLTHSALTHGAASVQVQLQIELVDHLLELVNRPADGRLSVRKLTHGLTHAKLGLMESGFDAERVASELDSLKGVLVDPWTRAANDPDLEIDPWTGPDAPAFAATQPMEARTDLGLHEALPTVPMDAMESEAGQGGSSSEAWIDALQTGTFCRMHLMGHWLNTRLLWCSGNRGMFVFASRHGGRMHTLSRRSLQKLRAAGLAASIENGQFVAQALRELDGD